MFLTPATTLGFGLAVRSALREVKTKYVWVQQHDWALEEQDVPLRDLLELMNAREQDNQVVPESEEVPPRIRYVSFPSVRMLRYARLSDVERYGELRIATKNWKGEYEPPDSSAGDENVKASTAIPLTPLFFWYDKPHIALKEHYLSRVFSNDELVISRGDFIEDTAGCAAREEMKAGGWRKWATWLYYPDEGETIVLRHLQGRTFRGKDEEVRMAAHWKTTGGFKRVKKGSARREADAKDPDNGGEDKVEEADADADEEETVSTAFKIEPVACDLLGPPPTLED